MATASIEGLRELILPENITRATNLDKFFEDLYSKKLQFTVDLNITSCIQVTVENFVKDLFDEVMKLQNVQEELQKLKNTYKHIPNLFKESKEVLCVGSFYEDTKNTFPDEFDYVLILLTAQRLIRTQPGKSRFLKENVHFSDHFHTEMTNILANNLKDLSEYAIKIQENQYFILEYKSFEQVGPALKLCFSLSKKEPAIFERASIDIHVDITPAIRVEDRFLEMYVDKICSVKEFRNEILNTGSFIVIQKGSTRESFTETEMTFMKHLLSSRHKTAYRILKYLINGNVEESKLRKLNKDSRLGLRFKLSSYVLKVFMINHHYSCNKNELWRESDCVLDVLKQIQDCLSGTTCKTVSIPSLNPEITLNICVGEPAVQLFTTKLTELVNALFALSESTEYNFNEVAIEPVCIRMYNYLSSIQTKQEKKRVRKRRIRRCICISIVIFLLMLVSLKAIK